MKRANLYALHGTLGTPCDWDFLGDNFLGDSLHKVSLFEKWKEPIKLWEWAADFNASLPIKEEGQINILMGYSLGGRLALHALLQNPDLWDGAIIISTNPGLKTEEERTCRLHDDLKWSHQLKNLGWEDFMSLWNNQEVLRGTPQIPRFEQDYDKKAIANAMTHWSIGLQEDLREEISTLSLPILWIVGANDTKYVQNSESLSFKNPLSSKVVFSETGHRVPWEQPEPFKSSLNHFIEKVYAQAKQPLARN